MVSTMVGKNYIYLTEEFEVCVQTINHFHNLRDVAVEFSIVYVVDDCPPNFGRRHAVESMTYRYKVLNAVFNALNDSEYSTPRLSSLTQTSPKLQR